MIEATMLVLAVVLCIYLIFIRSSIKERYPLFYAYLLVCASFELFFSACDFEDGRAAMPCLIGYQVIYLFQLYLLAHLWREVLQRDYPSLRLLIYLTMGLASMTTLAWSARTIPLDSPLAAFQSNLVLNGLTAPSFFVALLLVITFNGFRIPIPRELRGIIYGLTLLTGFDFMAIFVSDGPGFADGYLRTVPWIASLFVYARYFASSASSSDQLNAEAQAMLMMNTHLLALDRRVFYGFMVKTRLYNPFTQTYYYHFCSDSLSESNAQVLANRAHFRKVYALYRYRWASLYYRLVDPLIFRLMRQPKFTPPGSEVEPVDSYKERPPFDSNKDLTTPSPSQGLIPPSRTPSGQDAERRAHQK